MKTVVTGGTGFIGSHLVRRLLEEKRDVVVIGGPSAIGTENLLDLGLEVECTQLDLRDYHQVLKAVSNAQAIFHLAARIGNIQYLHGTAVAELTALQTNLLIDGNVFQACLERGVEKLVYASSVAVYPLDKQSLPNAVLSETDLVLRPGNHSISLNPDGGYGWAKFLGELQLNYMESPAIGIARIFNVYGENEPLDTKAHAVGDLIRKAILYPMEEFRIWGDGNQSRDLLYVADCVAALLKLEGKATNPPVTVNIGSGQATSIRELAGRIIEISGKKMQPSYDTQKPFGPISRTADLRRTKALLGWQPSTSLETGLRRTYRWAEGKLIEH
jgi:GDP-D-mannose 3',5'-epimerase